MDEHYNVYDFDGAEDSERYYDNVDDISHQPRIKRVLYPSRLMVDFKGLGLAALKRYAKYYHLKLNENTTKEDLAAQVARHFDLSLEVEEDDSIVAFMQRLRNGERAAVKRSTVRDKERKLQAAVEKAKRKSNSRKRQRDHSVSSGRNTSNFNHHSSNGVSMNASNHGHGNSYSSGGNNTYNSRGNGNDGRKGPPNSSKLSNLSGGKTKKTKKDADTGEDNELYCICNLPSYGNMIACDGKTCPNPSQWYHLECVGLADGRHPDTWLCPECDPKGFLGGSSNSHRKKKNKRSKSPGNK
ncbi:putative Zinc finger, PHD-type, Zinc finger, FYVE/PHD-type, Zinc finger, RING/FYVE/PHD-type [Plasmopara halstedii]